MIAIINNTVINLTIGLLNFNFILLVLLLWTSVRGGKFNMSLTGSSGSSTFSFVSFFSFLLFYSYNVFISSFFSFIFIISYFIFNFFIYYLFILLLYLWIYVQGFKFNISITGSSCSSTFSFVSLFSTLLTSSNNVFKSSSASFIFITSYFKFNYKT